MIQALKGSPKIHTPMIRVDMGPIMPIWEVKAGPMRSMAIMTIKTGKAVQATALSKDSQSTGSGVSAQTKGLSKAYCKRQNTQATDVAQPARRKVFR